MREYKFRGKTLDGNEWCYGYLIVKPDKQTLIEQCDELRRISPQYVVNPDTVGQSSELPDCDGHEIYEGDIVNYRGENGLVVFWLGDFAVYFDSGPASLGQICFCGYNNVSPKIVGNKYDNPELWEVKEDA